MAKWKDFLYSSKKFLKRNFIKGTAPPGAIDNKSLLGPQNTLKQGMKRNVNFRIVNDYIWQIFKLLYGGGPALVINDFNSRKKNYLKVTFLNEEKGDVREMINDKIQKKKKKKIISLMQ